MPPDTDAAEVTARRILNWIYAWQRLAPSDGHAALLLDSLADQVAHVRANLAPERNHRTLELYALLVAALALPELDRDGLLDLAVTELDRNLRDRLPPRRRPPRGLDALPRDRAAVVRRRARERAPLRGRAARRVRRPARPRLRVRRPLHAAGRDDPGAVGRRPRRLRALLVQAADLLGDEAALRRHARPRGPRAALRHASFPDGGYYVQRSGWSPRARFLIFDCGPLGDGGHGHYDALSVEAHGDGRPLVVDPGRGSYSEAPPNLRRWFRGTAAHNTVCVDGLDQTPYTRGRPLGAVAQARFLGRGTTAGLDLLAGEVVSPAYDAVHERRIAFVGDRYWIVEDRLHGEREHRFDLRWHLAPEAQGAARVDGATVRAPGLALVILGAEHVALEPGWVAPSYGVRLDAPVVSAVAQGTSARFVTLLAPHAPASRRRGSRSTRPGGCGWRSTARATRSTCARRAATGSARAARERGAGMTALLAPDPAVPQRDALLDERRMGRARHGPDRRRGRRLRARAREVPRRRQPARRLPGRGGRRVAHRRRADVRRPQRERLPPRRRDERPRAAARVLHAPELETCSGRSPTTAGWPGCGCSTAAPARSTGSSAGRSPARGSWPTRPSAPRPPSASTRAAACSPT